MLQHFLFTKHLTERQIIISTEKFMPTPCGVWHSELLLAHKVCLLPRTFILRFWPLLEKCAPPQIRRLLLL